MKYKQTLDEFLKSVGCEKTNAKYVETLNSMCSEEFRQARDFEYAEALVYFGKLERRVTKIMAGTHVRGSRTEFRLAS